MQTCKLGNGTEVRFVGNQVIHFGTDGSILYFSEKKGEVAIEGSRVKHIAPNGEIFYDSKADCYSEAKDSISHFFLMGKPERAKVAEWFSKVKPSISTLRVEECKFLDRVQRALEVIDYDYQIATIKPSINRKGSIVYEEGQKSGYFNLRLGTWEERASDFYSDGEWHSELAQLEEGDLFKAYRIAMGHVTIEDVTLGIKKRTFYMSYDSEGCYGRLGETYEIYRKDSGFIFVDAIFYMGGSYMSSWPEPQKSFESYSGCGVLVLKH